MVLLPFGREPIGFLHIKHLGVSVIFFQDLFGSGDGGAPFYPCLGPGHCDLPSFPIDLGVEGSQPWVAEYYSVFS